MEGMKKQSKIDERGQGLGMRRNVRLLSRNGGSNDTREGYEGQGRGRNE